MTIGCRPTIPANRMCFHQHRGTCQFVAFVFLCFHEYRGISLLFLIPLFSAPHPHDFANLFSINNIRILTNLLNCIEVPALSYTLWPQFPGFTGRTPPAMHSRSPELPEIRPFHEAPASPVRELLTGDL